MRSKILLSVLVIALAAALLAGATGAWFTGTADLAEAEFTAGTVEVSVIGGPTDTPLPGRSIENVNPGDCATVCWEIANTGTKKAELRVKIEDNWLGVKNNNTDRVAYYYPVEDGWVLYEDDDGEMWLYYTGGSVNGTYGDTEATSIPLCLVVAFDGEGMGNDFQKARYSISGEVEAIQATNDAPVDAWGAAWTEVNGDYDPTGHLFYGKVKNTECYNGGVVDDDELKARLVVWERTTCNGYTKYIRIRNSDLVGGLVNWEIGEGSVCFTANNTEGYTFVGWYSKNPTTYGNLNNHIVGEGSNKITVDNNEVNYHVIFTKCQPQ